MTIAVCAVVCGANDGVAVETFGHAKKEVWLRTFLPLPGGIPSHHTFGRVFARLDPTELQRGFFAWIQTVVGKLPPQVVAVDGKTLRRSADRSRGQAALHLVRLGPRPAGWSWAKRRPTPSPTRSQPSLHRRRPRWRYAVDPAYIAAPSSAVNSLTPRPRIQLPANPMPIRAPPRRPPDAAPPESAYSYESWKHLPSLAIATRHRRCHRPQPAWHPACATRARPSSQARPPRSHPSRPLPTRCYLPRRAPHRPARPRRLACSYGEAPAPRACPAA